MVIVTFSDSGRKAIYRLNDRVQEEVLNCLDDIEEGTRDRQDVMQTDYAFRYHYIRFDFDPESYIVIAELSRHYGDQEDEIKIVDAGLQSAFIIG